MQVIGALKKVEQDLEKQREDVSHILEVVNELRYIFLHCALYILVRIISSTVYFTF